MEIKKIDADSLTVPEILSLLEIAQGVSRTRPDWKQLKRKLTRYDSWGFYDGDELIGFALANDRSPYFGGSVQIVELKYRWQYNQESTVAQMLRGVAQKYQGMSDLIVMDIDIRHDLNRGLYQKLGFTNSVMRSPLDRDHGVLYFRLDSLLKN